MTRETLNETFGRFAGREVGVYERPPFESNTIGGEKVQIPLTYILVDDDRAVTEMADEASARGLWLNVCLPGQENPGRFDPKRLNATVEKAPDGVWRVANDFHIG